MSLNRTKTIPRRALNDIKGTGIPGILNVKVRSQKAAAGLVVTDLVVMEPVIVICLPQNVNGGKGPTDRPMAGSLP